MTQSNKEKAAMDASLDSLRSRHTFKAQNLVDEHPPKLKNKNKKIVYQIACLVFHTGVDATGAQDFATAQRILHENLAPVGSNLEVSALVAEIQALEFQWGIGDGN